jgi:hypothetical protein
LTGNSSASIAQELNPISGTILQLLYYTIKFFQIPQQWILIKVTKLTKDRESGQWLIRYQRSPLKKTSPN